jgi:hypothetical protein
LAPTDPDRSTIFAETPGGTGETKQGGTDAAVPGDAGAASPAAPIPPPSVVSSDPLQRGLERLTAHDFLNAVKELDSARSRYVLGRVKERMPLTPEQQLTLEGLAAAYIGQGRPDAAKGPLETAYGHNVRTRSLVLNTAIYMLSGQRPLNSLTQAAELVRQQMGHQQNDEYAADIFGTLVNKISTMDRAPKDKLDEWWKFHDNYIDALAARGDVGQPGKLKWGVEWLPAEDVKRYRNARNVTNPGVGAAAKDVEVAQARVRSAETALKKAKADRANGGTADVTGAESQLDAANAALVKASKALNDANDAVNAKKPRWLEKFNEPVLPQQAAAAR